MNKKGLAAAFVLALLASVLAGTQLVSVGKANPFFWYEEVPPDAYTEAPVISVLSPANNIVLNENNVYLSFNVDVGESETAAETVLFFVRYQADWQNDNIDYFYPESAPFSHEVNLTGIPEGNHSIQFQAIERGAYNNTHVFTIASSETILFTIDTSPETTIPEFPSWTILPLFLIATFFALAVRKRLFHPISQLQ
jgi:hypothetical protein